jgi:hypothetical protein
LNVVHSRISPENHCVVKVTDHRRRDPLSGPTAAHVPSAQSVLYEPYYRLSPVFGAGRHPLVVVVLA